MNYTSLANLCSKASSNIKMGDLESHNGNYPIYGASGLIKKVDFYVQDKPYIAVVKDGAGVGRIITCPAFSSVIGTLQYIIPNSGVDVDYLAYAMEHMNLSKYYMGAAIPHIYFKDYSKEKLICNTLQQQKLISKRLNTITTLIGNRKKMLSDLENIVKSRFIEMFGNPETNSKCLPTKRFDSICENLDSRRIPITASERKVGVYPYYGASGIVDYVNDYIFDEDVLLISEDGANLLMRTTPIAFSVSGKVWVNNHAHVVKFETMSLQKYIEVYFSMIDISDQITGSAQPKLNQAKLNAMQFGVPDIPLLDKFYAFVCKVDKSKLEVKKSIEKLEILKKSLMQQYFG